MNWKRCGIKRSWPNLRRYPGICVEGLRKTTTNLSQDSRSPGRDLNPGPPEYEGVLTTRPGRSVVTGCDEKRETLPSCTIFTFMFGFQNREKMSKIF
jgi:hypothetical protein